MISTTPHPEFLKQCLDFNEIELLDKTKVERQLNRWAKIKELDWSLQEHPELLPYVDTIANQLLALEDRLRYLTQLESLEKANEVRWANKC